MTITQGTYAPPPANPQDPDDVPRGLDTGTGISDRAFELGSRGVGILVLVITGTIGGFLGFEFILTVQRYGMGFLTHSVFNPERNQIGILAAIVGTIEVAIVALAVAFPLALATALYITEYAPRWLRSFLVLIVDLMAAVPSIIYGVWGALLLQTKLLLFSRWLAEWFSWIPFFSVPGQNSRSAGLPDYSGGSAYELSDFAAGVTVAMMVIPIICSVMRNVFAQAPQGEREAALALGSTRWGVIRTVVLPFGRGGIIAGTMLGLGRALGETVAVALILSLDFGVKIHILATGGVTISSLIAIKFGEATGAQLKGLLAAGFVLFVMTLAVNTAAGVIVARSRSGAGVDL